MAVRLQEREQAVTGQPSAVDVLPSILWRLDHPDRMDGIPEHARRLFDDRARRLADMLAAAGLLATPERLAQERAAALGEAAREWVSPQWWKTPRGAVCTPYGVWRWLRARAEVERAGGGA